MDEWLLIALMAAVTFLPRYLPIALAGRLQFSPALESALNFVPIAVLTAIIAQSALLRDGALDFSAGNYHALAALAAFVAALLWRSLFVTIVVGLLCFVVLRVLAG